MHINEYNKMITLDIKVLYVNLPIKSIIHITKFWIIKHNKMNSITEQILPLLKVILQQN